MRTGFFLTSMSSQAFWDPFSLPPGRTAKGKGGWRRTGNSCQALVLCPAVPSRVLPRLYMEASWSRSRELAQSPGHPRHLAESYTGVLE